MKNIIKKKIRPYEPLVLSYEIITGAMGSDASDLKEMLSIADQITPTLSVGLKGNPRNIKRFLNTLFLRMKIARIYGLDDIIKLQVLAKLMLLERFHREKFAMIVDEISLTQDGISKSIKILESKQLEEKPSDSSDANSLETDFNAWISIKPLLGDVDLRPYVFVSKEKAVGFEIDSSIPENLSTVLQHLNSNNGLSLNQAEKELEKLNAKDRKMLFDELENQSRSVADFKKLPAPVAGLLRIIKIDPLFEERFVALLDSYPSSQLGPWAVSELSGLSNSEAKKAFQSIIEKWSVTTDNNILKTLAGQNLKNKN